MRTGTCLDEMTGKRRRIGLTGFPATWTWSQRKRCENRLARLVHLRDTTERGTIQIVRHSHSNKHYSLKFTPDCVMTSGVKDRFTYRRACARKIDARLSSPRR